MKVTLHQLPAQGYHCLREVTLYKSNSDVIESEDCFYCAKCGEKALLFALSFHKDTCESCVIDTLMP